MSVLGNISVLFLNNFLNFPWEDGSMNWSFWNLLLLIIWWYRAFLFCYQCSVYQVEGTTERPRLCVFRSNKHLYVQVIDDTKMHTLASASTMQKPISEEFDFSAGPTIVSSQISICGLSERKYLLPKCCLLV